ncbi:MAG: SHOCT domain-containing protein [Candidatus Doudnabacteria bacterium]
MYGWAAVGGIMMFVFWIVIIFIILWAFQEFTGNNLEATHKKSAMDILKERYARGEIDKKEFEEKQKDLNN